MKKILIAGASGFLGKHLAQFFLSKNYSVIGLGMSQIHPFSKEFDTFEWVSADTTIEGNWQEKVDEADVIINLTGKTIFSYWTKKYKQEIYNSRIMTTRHIVDAVRRDADRLLLSASAIGFYGDAGEELLTENSSQGSGFLSEVCRDWEKEADLARQKGVRVCRMRLGVILGEGGALAKMVPAFKAFAGGPLGSGEQWFPWIHIHDIASAVQFLLKKEELEGVFNFVGPDLLRQKNFASALGQVLGRPSVMPAPAFIVKTIMGEMGKSLLQSQKASPRRLLDEGFVFKHENAMDALKNILKK